MNKTPKRTHREMELLDALHELGGSARSAELAKALDLSEETVRRTILSLSKSGVLERMDGAPETGVIGMPAPSGVFLGVKDKRATLNRAPIQSSDRERLDQAILYINEGEKIYGALPGVFDRLLTTRQTRRFSYDCSPDALLPAGHVDAVVDYDLQPYDRLPLMTVIEESVGMITYRDGNPLTLHSDGRVILAATAIARPAFSVGA
jgi:fructose-1,6-bisphosphatase/inositol monophosphatase family enzyme